MATLKFYKDSYSPGVYQPPGFAPFRRNIDLPALVAASPAPLASTSDVRTALASTGFAAADILQVFQVSLGFCLRMVGVRVTTVEGATCTADIGNCSATQTHRLAANPDGFMGTCDLNSATTQITLITDEDLGGSTYEGVVFVTNGSIDVTFGHASTETAIFDVFAMGAMCF